MLVPYVFQVLKDRSISFSQVTKFIPIVYQDKKEQKIDTVFGNCIDYVVHHWKCLQIRNYLREKIIFKILATLDMITDWNSN